MLLMAKENFVFSKDLICGELAIARLCGREQSGRREKQIGWGGAWPLRMRNESSLSR